MGAKRAVPGRSLPYDMLLAAYQKKNQAKQQSKWLSILKQLLRGTWSDPSGLAEAALDANAPIEDDDEPNLAVDSDEETAIVMGALANWRPRPVLPPPIFEPLKRTYQLERLHEQLQMATNGGRTNIFKVIDHRNATAQPGMDGSNNIDMEDAPGEPDMMMSAVNAQRSSSFGMQVASRRPSVASRA